jgi:RHS repeat-associated protein
VHEARSILGPTTSPAAINRTAFHLASLLTALIASLAALSALAAPASANTAVTSAITANTTWTEAGSPYDLDASNLSVKAGVTLTIEPGVTVDFNGGSNALFSVYGVLKAVGTAARPITFTSHQALEGLGSPGQYAGLDVWSEGTTPSQFSYTTITYGGTGSGGYYNYGVLAVGHGVPVTVDHTTIEHNSYSGVHVASKSTVTVTYSTIANNGNGIAVLAPGSVSVRHSSLSNNSTNGAWFDMFGGGPSSSFLYDSIRNNSSFGVYTDPEECAKLTTYSPHGEYNNIYGNGGKEEPGKQIWTYYKCHALPVDWEHNYWGPEVYFYRNDPECARSATPYPGHLAYTWSKPANSWEVPKGPLPSGSISYSSPYKFQCGYDTFKITEIQHSPIETGAPEPTNSSLFGSEPGLFAPFLPTVQCGEPVNCITGNFYETRADLRVPGLNGGLDFRRTYNSLAALEGAESALGRGWSYEYGERLELDPSGTAATITNADGSRVTFTEEEGAWTAPAWVQATLVKNEDGSFTYTLPSQRAFHFSGEGRLESIADRNGNETTLTYNEAGQLTSVTDPSERRLTFAYDGAGKIESVTDPAGRKAAFSYDEEGDLTSVTDPGEVSERYEYNASHELTKMTDPRGGETTNVYDTAGRVTSQTDPMERKTSWAYGEEETEVTLPNEAVTKIAFADNLPTEITHAYGTEEAATTRYEYNEDLYPIARTDPDGHKTEFGYDAEGNRTSEKDGAGDETTKTYNSKHQIVSITTPRGERTTIERDAHGNPTRVSRPAPGEATQTTSFEYDAKGELTSLTDPLERTWRYGYDSHGDRTSATDPEGDETTFSYDEDSRLTSFVSPRGNVEGAEASQYETTIERDAQGRPTKITDPLGHATEYGYDGNGNLTSITDAKGHTTRYTYDADNERTKVERPNGATLESGYDAGGRITSQTDANRHTTRYVRNLLERPVETIDPLERKTSEEYDAAGNLKSLTDPAGRTTSYEYDAANRPTKVSYSDGITPTAEFGYDRDGNVTSMSDGTGESSYAYDLLDRLTEATDGHGSTVAYEYDLGEELKKLTYPNGKAVTRSFDEAGRLASVTDWLKNTTSFAYNADSALTGITFPEATANTDEYAYDRADAMSEAKMKKGAETLASLSYARDRLGQLESLTAIGLPGAAEESFSYDENNRLTKAGTSSFGYDAADNLTSAPGTTNSYDAADQLESGTGVAYSYDRLGERTRAAPEVGPATSYAYDQAGDLTAVERPAEGEVPAIAETMTYDGSGLLASRRSGETTRYLTWDQSGGLPLLLDDGQASYLYGPGGLPVEQIEGETPTYIHHDQLGSTRLLTNATGEAVGKFTYGAYGKLEASSGTATTPLGFAGQYTDPQTGMEYLRARFYDPATGQFMSRDPIEALTGQPYSYALDSPLNLVDPGGLAGEEAVAAAGGTCLGTVEVPIVGEVACAAAGAAGLTYGAVTLAEALSGDEESSEGVPAESNASETEPCSEPSEPQPFEGTKATRGDPRQAMNQAANEVDQLNNAAGSNPNAPGGGPRSTRVAALLARLFNIFHHTP